jgi:hypothetical protein
VYYIHINAKGFTFAAGYAKLIDARFDLDVTYIRTLCLTVMGENKVNDRGITTLHRTTLVSSTTTASGTITGDGVIPMMTTSRCSRYQRGSALTTPLMSSKGKGWKSSSVVCDYTLCVDQYASTCLLLK